MTVGDARSLDPAKGFFGVILQYPATDGAIDDWKDLIARAHAGGALVTMACDLLALTLLVPPGELGADIAVGSAQRFGVPLGYGGPHAAFFACRNDLLRRLPGRIIGVSAWTRRASRRSEWRCRRASSTFAARRRPATSARRRRCSPTSPSMYAVYHGPEGSARSRERVHAMAAALARWACGGLACARYNARFFDTLPRRRRAGHGASRGSSARGARKMNLRRSTDGPSGSLSTRRPRRADLDALLAIFTSERVAAASAKIPSSEELAKDASPALAGLERERVSDPSVFQAHHSETEMMRYLRTPRVAGHLARSFDDPARVVHDEAERHGRDDARHLVGVRTHAPVRSDGAGARLPEDRQTARGDALRRSPDSRRCALQPNSGAQGEFAGLMVIRKYHESRGDSAPQRRA